MDIKNQKGQTLVEYILLLVVAVSLVMTLYKSQTFKKLFGEEGALGTKIKNQNEFAYRHAFYGSGPNRVLTQDISINNKDMSAHPSYVEKSGTTRFFGPREPYGE